MSTGRSNDRSWVQTARAGGDPGAGTLGIVVIGRNLGERLGRAIRAAAATGAPVVYADSGSTDGSVEMARAAGAETVELDRAIPFTAARGRNEGFAALRDGGLPRFIMFVDGDVELAPGWVGPAVSELSAHPRVAVVTGHLRERDRETRTLARVCDMDWAGPVGDLPACGGIFMARSEAFERVGGFDPGVPTGEEAELCARLRRDGWIVRRIDVFMGEHDAGMTTFGQWWARAVRVGEGYVAAVRREGASRDTSKVRRIASNVVWGAVLPMIALVCVVLSPRWPWVITGGALVAITYGVQWLRIARSARDAGRVWRDAGLYATFCLLAKWAHFAGHVRAVFLRPPAQRGRGQNSRDPTGLCAPTPSPVTEKP